MGLRDRFKSDLKEALRSRDENKKLVIRMSLAAIQLAEAKQGSDLDDKEIVVLLREEVEKRRETIEELKGASRPEMLAEEKAQLQILESYLPQMLTREEIVAEARDVIEEVGASSPRDMGQVMSELMPRVKGRAEGGVVSQVVRELLSQ